MEASGAMTPCSAMRSNAEPIVSRARIVTALVLLACTTAGFVYRIVDVQATPDRRILEEVSFPLYEITVPAARGTVLDRNERTIALSLPAATVVSNPRQISDPEAVAQALSEALDKPAEELMESLEGDAAFRYVVRQIDRELGERITALELDGIRVIDEPQREHPNGDCSAIAAVGRVNIDHVGMSGIEETHNEHLAGVPGRIIKETSPDGATIPGGLQQVTAAVVGRDLTLTLDRNVQYQTERLLIDAVGEAEAASGVALVSVPSTGEVIAMANVKRNSGGLVDCTRQNLAATWSYEPGSVFKPVTVAAAMSRGAVSESTRVTVPSELVIWDHRFVDTPSHGRESWTPSEILTRSSNLGAIVLARKAGERTLYSTMRSFGFGSLTDLQLKGETKGILAPVTKWNGLSLPNMAMGQGLAVTPLQLLQAYNVIANNGVLMPLNIIMNEAEMSHGVRSETAGPTQAIAPGTASALMRMLHDAVEEGTGWRAMVDGFTMAGKTGTAWQPCDEGYLCLNQEGEPDGRHYTATFAGIVSNSIGPALVVVVIIDDPRGDRFYGGQLAAPLVGDIAAYAVRQLRIPADSDAAPTQRRRAEPAPQPPPQTPDAVTPDTLTVIDNNISGNITSNTPGDNITGGNISGNTNGTGVTTADSASTET